MAVKTLKNIPITFYETPVYLPWVYFRVAHEGLDDDPLLAHVVLAAVEGVTNDLHPVGGTHVVGVHGGSTLEIDIEVKYEKI